MPLDSGFHKSAKDQLDEAEHVYKGITNKTNTSKPGSPIQTIGGKSMTQIKQEADVKSEELKEKAEAEKEREHKYTPDTQPRDNKGEYRRVLARLKGDLHLAGLHGVAADAKHIEDLHDGGRHEEALKASKDLLNKVDILKKNVKKEGSLKRLNSSSKDLDDALSKAFSK